ncbi:unnamed protein product, partial [Polarella glacialis]
GDDIYPPPWLEEEPRPALEAVEDGSYVLPRDFGGRGECEELLIMARAVWRSRRRIYTEAMQRSEGGGSSGGASLSRAVASEHLPQAVAAYRAAKEASEILSAAGHVRATLSWYNHTVRLALRRKDIWPRAELAAMARSDGKPGVLPPQTPCEYVEESLCWWAFGQHSCEDDWLGHGYFWRPSPAASEADPWQIENAAGNAMMDFDLLEDRFRRLRGASVLTADYALLRRHFPSLRDLGDGAVDSWLLDDSAWLSEGQAQRLRPGGDHHELIVPRAPAAAAWDESTSRSALRLRSGGRAATFFVNDRYDIAEDGSLVAEMLDVKGLGTHERADTSSPKVTGLLGLADALRELCFQRLLQRLVELEGLSDSLGTVPFYALIDTGLTYEGTNPATGWTGERCVLLVRQRQSRLFDAYDGINFSGICPDHVHSEGPGRAMRRLLHSWGLSAEFEPRALWHLSSEASSDGVCDESLLGDQSGVWNLQVDAPCTHFMDFSDYYALPRSPLLAAWRMSETALQHAFTLERTPSVERALAHPDLATRLWGSPDKETSSEAYEALRRQLSQQKELRDAAASVEQDTGLIRPMKPKYCMCWFMELDDSEVSRWCMETAKEVATCHSLGSSTRDWLQQIE